MGLGAALILIGTAASVDALVVLYAINVFVTFTLSQLGMTVHWWRVRKTERTGFANSSSTASAPS